MLFKPIDEMSLRHLFSTSYATGILKMEYYGPVLNENGNIEPSPDCLVLDKRQSQYLIKRCEFKFKPRDVNAFRDNGRFDIAIVWDLDIGANRNQLVNDLRDNHGCHELIVLNENRKFRRLDDYQIYRNVNFHNIERLKDILLNIDFDGVYTAYLFAKTYPRKLNSQRLIAHLTGRFRRIQDMGAQGRGNAYGRFVQTVPPLIKRMYGNYYKWNDELEPNAALNAISRIIVENYEEEVPDDGIIEDII